MRQILIQQIAVLVLLGAGVEQGGSVLQTEPADPLLHEVEVLVAVIVLLLQSAHVVSLVRTGTRFDYDVSVFFCSFGIFISLISDNFFYYYFSSMSVFKAISVRGL